MGDLSDDTTESGMQELIGEYEVDEEDEEMYFIHLYMREEEEDNK